MSDNYQPIMTLLEYKGIIKELHNSTYHSGIIDFKLLDCPFIGVNREIKVYLLWMNHLQLSLYEYFITNLSIDKPGEDYIVTIIIDRVPKETRE